MILDTGICSIYSIGNTAPPGATPERGPILKAQAWYGQLHFETSPRDADMQEQVEIAARIRIHQNRSVSNHDVVVLSGDATQYEIIRAYHGSDQDNGQPITDLTLTKAVAVYDLV